jgi:nicotinic acid phosphoribosyltransferase
MANATIIDHFLKRAEELSDEKRYNGKTFLDFANDPNMTKIIDKFGYLNGNNTAVVKDKDHLINAFFANDLYKLSMGPVVNEVSKHQHGCIVQFRIDLRTDSTFNEALKNDYVLKKGSTFVDDLVTKLDELTGRTFDKGVLDYTLAASTPPPTAPAAPVWINYWKSDKAVKIIGQSLIESDRQIIMQNYLKKDGAPITAADFHGETVVLNCIPVPKDPTMEATVVLSVVFEHQGQKPDIRATGYWPLCSWLETPLMQTTYEVMHTHFLQTNRITYGAWMAEALYRTFSGMMFLNGKNIKTALFSGRRTGGALFNLLQIYLWNQFDTPGNPVAGGKNLGTSSFWALATLKNKFGIESQIKPSGTHAHELSMTLNVLYPDLDITDKGFVGSQILGHLLYKRLSAGATATPMLTDTVGTRNFLVTAIALKDGGKPALCSFAAARQDSGKLADYKAIMVHYATEACGKLPGLMASEIDDRDEDFKIAIEQGYGLAGVGGALGDSEKIESMKILGMPWIKTNPKHFAASEAAKIACAWTGKGHTGYTLKTGDGAGKVTIDDKADPKFVTELTTRAAIFQKFHLDAIEALKAGKTPTALALTPAEIAEKQQMLDKLLDEICGGRVGGGSRRHRRRQTQRKVRKSTRKTKKRKSNRRRYSKK